MLSESARLFWEIGPRYSIRPQWLLVQRYYERVTGNRLPLPNFIWLDLLNKCIPLLKSIKVKTIFNNGMSKRFLVQFGNNVQEGVFDKFTSVNQSQIEWEKPYDYLWNTRNILGRNRLLFEICENVRNPSDNAQKPSINLSQPSNIFG